MYLRKILPTKFSTRLFTMTLLAGLIPVLIFAVQVEIYGDSLKQAVEKKIEEVYRQDIGYSEAVLKDMGEAAIRRRALDVAVQLDLVLRSVPWMRLNDLEKDKRFREIAVQRISSTGYTSVLDSDTGLLRFYQDREGRGIDLVALGRTVPALGSIVKAALEGKNAGGYYEWKDANGRKREKYLYIAPLTQRTADGARLSVVAATYVDEFAAPIVEAKALHNQAKADLIATTNRLAGSFKHTGLLFMALGILTISVLAYAVGAYFSKSITQLREATSRVNQGEFNVWVKPSMSGEVGTLVQDFNKMVAQLASTTVSKQSLEQSEEKLRKANTGLLREVRERARAEEALAAEKDRLMVTLRSIGDGVITADKDGSILLLNKAAEELTGWTQEEARGRNLPEVLRLIDEESREQCADLVGTIIEPDQSLSDGIGQKILITRQGAERFIAESGSPLWDGKGEVLGVVIVFHDTGEKRKTEEELLNVRKLESIAVLAGGIAHDFNNLLAVVLGNISLAQLFMDKKEKLSSQLKEAETACLRGKELTYQLLSFAKGGEPVKKVMSLVKLIRESVKFTLSGSSVKSVFSLAEDLSRVEVDEGQMRQVIHNLIINAREAMPRGGTLKISASNVTLGHGNGVPLREGKYVFISVEDEGIGIEESHLEKVFDPYFTTKEMGSQKGTGLGLTICYSIIKTHRGFMTVKSAGGKGTTINIYLPAYDRVVKLEEKKTGLTAGKGRLLYMDDEEAVRNMASEILGYMGYDVKLAADGSEAIELYQQALQSGAPFDAVLMDLTIPGGMGGKETIKRLRKIDPSVKAIVSSGYSNDHIINQYRKYGFAGVVRKPYQIDEISKVVKDVLAGYPASDEAGAASEEYFTA